MVQESTSIRKRRGNENSNTMWELKISKRIRGTILWPGVNGVIQKMKNI